MSVTKVSRQDIRSIIFDNYNDTDVRFSNDEILEHLNQDEKYKALGLDVLDFEDVLLEMEGSGLLRPIAQNFNTRYYRLWNELEPAKCKSCGLESYFSQPEENKLCPQCRAKL
jgi:predicted Zn-ribbon and HTH transcriptional regulator